MTVAPIVRYMLLCDDWRVDGPTNRRYTIVGLISNFHSTERPGYHLFIQEFCVFLAITEGRGQGEGQIVCLFEENGAKIFETPKHKIIFTPDPLEVVAVSFRIRNCPFPAPGRYQIQFWYDGVMIEERTLRMR